jgi:hypothetical protein
VRVVAPWRIGVVLRFVVMQRSSVRCEGSQVSFDALRLLQNNISRYGHFA